MPQQTGSCQDFGTRRLTMMSLSQIPTRGMQSQAESHIKMSRPEDRSRANVHMDWIGMGAHQARLAPNCIEHLLLPFADQ